MHLLNSFCKVDYGVVYCPLTKVEKRVDKVSSGLVMWKDCLFFVICRNINKQNVEKYLYSCCRTKSNPSFYNIL